MLEACVGLAGILENAGRPVQGTRVMEVGTGRGLNMPLGLFLCGAESVITFDLHRYLKPSLVMRQVRVLAENQERIFKIFEGRTEAAGLRKRLELLSSASNLDDVLRRAQIQYRAPADAACTGLSDHGIDIHMSYTVFEHIPRQVLRSILVEANRLLAPGGFALHEIDPSDHFAHSDRSILPINFLQYSENEWSRLAGNQFGYHNRMRASDFADLYSECGHETQFWKPFIDRASLEAMRNGFSLNAQFRNYPIDVLSTVGLQVLSRPRAEARS